MHKKKSSYFLRKLRTVQTSTKTDQHTLSKELVKGAPEPLNGIPQTWPSASSIILPSLCSPCTSTTPRNMWHSPSHLSAATRAWESCVAVLGGTGPQCSPSSCFSLAGASLAGSKPTSRTSCCLSPSHWLWSLKQPLRLQAANPCDFQSFPNFGKCFCLSSSEMEHGRRQAVGGKGSPTQDVSFIHLLAGYRKQRLQNKSYWVLLAF